jgi:glycosyltransferase involved in cell wall biosynthesis
VRVCVVSQEYPPGYVGGIGTQSQIKARGLAQAGHEVTVLTAGADTGPLLRRRVRREDDLLEVYELRSPGGEFPVYETPTYWLGYTWTVLEALSTLTSEVAFDVVDFPEYAAEGVAFQLERQPDDSTAVVVHLHGSLSMFSERVGWPSAGEPLERLGTAMEDVSITGADRLLAASRSIADFTTNRLGLPSDRVDVVGGSVNADAFRPRQDSVPLDGPIRLLFVGNVAGNKGVRTVFDAFLALAHPRPTLSLTVAGTGDEELLRDMLRDAQAAGLSQRFVTLGFVEHAELPELYRSADILAAPSRWEGGLGMVYLEAMASGLPVVATAAGGAAEAVRHGETGFLLEHGDVEEATQAIRVLVDEPDLRRRMGVAARAHVEAEFATPPYVARVEASYARAVEHRLAAVLRW